MSFLQEPTCKLKEENSIYYLYYTKQNEGVTKTQTSDPENSDPENSDPESSDPENSDPKNSDPSKLRKKKLNSFRLLSPELLYHHAVFKGTSPTSK